MIYSKCKECISYAICRSKMQQMLKEETEFFLHDSIILAEEIAMLTFAHYMLEKHCNRIHMLTLDNKFVEILREFDLEEEFPYDSRTY